MTADFYDDDDREPMALGHILYEKPAADRRKIRYPWRETVAAIPAGDPMTPAEKAVKLWELEQESAKQRQPGQTLAGPLTRAFYKVLRAMLNLHHSATGVASYSYETLAEEAHVHVSTVARALPVIERLTGVLIFRRVLPVTRQVRAGFSTNRTSNVYLWRLKTLAEKVRAAREYARSRPKSQAATEPFNSKNTAVFSTNSRQQQAMRASRARDSAEAKGLASALARLGAAIARGKPPRS